MRKKSNHRGEKLGEEIRRIISELLTRELKDPAFEGMISISHVKATDDGSFATVYFTALGADEEAALAGFEKAKGFIRNEINRKLGLRRSPDLRFKLDEAERYGQYIDSIIDSLDLPPDADEAGKMVEFHELIEIIDKYERYFLFTHVHMDGDTLGAAVAFADSMREIGREAWVITDEDILRTLQLLNYDFVLTAAQAAVIFTEDREGATEYLGIEMDFTDRERLAGREEFFDHAAETLSIDHHVTSKAVCDYNYQETEAAATSEIVYKLLRAADLPVTEKAATALYVGILTDTGRFQYTNTTPETHRIAADLMEAGADFKTAYHDIYQSIKAEKLYVQSAMLNTLDIFADGKAALAYVEYETLEKLDAGDDETDGMSEVLRSIIGVEVSIFLKVRADKIVKASMRSKNYFDVAAFAAEFGGGGHVRAAGFTSDLPLKELCAVLKKKLTAELN